MLAGVSDVDGGQQLQLTNDGRILFPADARESGTDLSHQTALGELRVDPATIPLIPSSTRLRVDHEDSPPEAQTNPAADGSIDGNGVLTVAPPIDLRLTLEDIPTGQELPNSLQQQSVTVALLLLADAPNLVWFMEVQEDGQFLGYLQLQGTFDPTSAKLLYQVAAPQLNGTFFLPGLAQPALVANHDPDAQMLSSP